MGKLKNLFRKWIKKKYVWFSLTTVIGYTGFIIVKRRMWLGRLPSWRLRRNSSDEFCVIIWNEGNFIIIIIPNYSPNLLILQQKICVFVKNFQKIIFCFLDLFFFCEKFLFKFLILIVKFRNIFEYIHQSYLNVTFRRSKYRSHQTQTKFTVVTKVKSIKNEPWTNLSTFQKHPFKYKKASFTRQWHLYSNSCM